MPAVVSPLALRRLCLSIGVAAVLSGCSGGDGGSGDGDGEGGTPVQAGEPGLGAALPDAPAVQFLTETLSASEADRHVPVQVVRTGPGTGRTVVRYLISGGSATPGKDVARVQGQLVWEDGEVGVLQIDLQPFSDVESERDERVELSLEPLEGDAVTGGRFALTLRDADCSATVIGRVQSDLALVEPCYRLSADVQVVGDAQLTLESGTTLLADAGVGIEMLDNATLVTRGTPLAPVTLAGTTAQPGWWRGVGIGSSAPMHRLDGLRLRDATIGLDVAAGSTLGSVSGGSIGNVSQQAASLPLEAAAAFDGTTVFDRTAGVTLTSGRLERGAALDLPALSTHYLLSTDLLVSGALGLQAGAELRFSRGRQLLVDVDGTLRAIGTQAAPVILRGVDFEPGFWAGVLLFGSVGDNRLEHVVIANGGSNVQRDGNLSVSGEATRLQAGDVSLAGSAGVGLWLDTRLPGVTLERIEFAENALAEVRQGAASGDLDTF